MRYFKSALILGSTSTVAKSICIKLAKNGCTRFHLVCKDLKKNMDLVNLLQKQFKAKVTQEENNLLFNCSLDNCFIPEIDFYHLYLISAGTLGDEKLARKDVLEALKINYVNYLGILPWLTQITKNNRLEYKGSLWVFTSVASERGRPSNYHYGSAKAALNTYCEGLLLRCQKKPFSIRIIKAGFMKTPMALDTPSFMSVSTNKVADYLMRRPQKRGIEYLPWWWSIIMFIVRNLPTKYAAKL